MYSVATIKKGNTGGSLTIRSQTLQRKCACGGAPGPDGECEACKQKRKKNEQIQRLGLTAGQTAPVPPIVNEVLGSNGESLDSGTRARFEPKFGHDFSKVKVHTGRRAAESARAVQAKAYAVGNDIVFGSGQYSPGTPQGDSVLAHELTHVVQNGHSSQFSNVAQSISSPSDPAEREAEAVANSFAAGSLVPAQSLRAGALHRLGANAGCSDAEAASVHQGIFDSRAWLNAALPKLAKTPLDPEVTVLLGRNFGPRFGVAANAKTIHDRLQTVLNAEGSIPYSCARAPADVLCATHCGYVAVSGSRQATMCANQSLRVGVDPVFRAGCILHETCHATFANMVGDSYSGWHGHSGSLAGYPGGNPEWNADSYTSLAIELSKE